MSYQCNACCPDDNGSGGNGQQILTDKFCGFLDLDCGNQSDDNRFVWQSLQNGSPAPVVGTITISYGRGCADELRAIIRRGGKLGDPVGEIIVPQGQGSAFNCKSLTLQEEFDTLEVICDGNGSNCEGEYCLSIHYPSPFTT